MRKGMSREDYIANTAKDIFDKIPLTSLDVGSYDLLQTRVMLLDKNEEDFITMPSGATAGVGEMEQPGEKDGHLFTGPE